MNFTKSQLEAISKAGLSVSWMSEAIERMDRTMTPEFTADEMKRMVDALVYVKEPQPRTVGAFYTPILSRRSAR